MAELLRSEREARAAAEAAERRATFLARASEALASSLDCETTLRAVAGLAVPVIADWCFIDMFRRGTFRRVAVSRAPASHAALARRLEEEHFLDADASLGPPQVLRSGVSELYPAVTDEFLREVARTQEAYELLREMDITSVMSVAIRDAEAIVGIITFVSSESRRRFATEDLRLAEDLAVRAGAAMENARLFELVHDERAAAQRHARRSAYLARASEILASSLDHKTTLSSVARLAVPDVADWCLVDMVELDGGLKTIALYHSDPAKTAIAREIGRRFPYDPAQPCFAPHVVATGEPELATRIPDEILRAGTRNEAHYRALAELGFRSYMCVPLVVRGRVAGAITFASAESGRSYEPEDLSLAEALAYRASLAIDNARLYSEAQDAIRVRDEFLSIASHELKTPVTTLQLQIQSLRRRLDSGRMEAGDPGLSKRLAISERQIERLTHLINNLLDISRITAGRMDLRIEEVDFAGVVRETVARLEDSLARAGCTLTLEVSDPQRGEWDKLRLEQIVTNLMSNAMKYGAGRPIEVSLSGTPDSVRLEVADFGIGIAPESQSRIFGRFERAVSERNYGGLGLGLWIVRQIVDALAGTVTVQSAAGKGSRFAVELPRRRAQPGKAAAEPSISAAPETPESGNGLPA
ncbi:MAG TPA: GAF domain-containing sensor histidine kinase [Thermoanaerobaculia bacterium]|nr:GAF domain-containing sensor histidine kinase [Thermoanaerobaculia bacterium]